MGEKIFICVFFSLFLKHFVNGCQSWPGVVCTYPVRNKAQEEITCILHVFFPQFMQQTQQAGKLYTCAVQVSGP